MITKDNIHAMAMRVNKGSGVLIHLSTGCFVATARHCINGKSNEVKNFNGTVEYEVEDVFFHENKESYDVALVKLKESIPVVFSKVSENVKVDDKIKVYGFPDKGDQDGMPLSGKILKWHDTKSIETEQPYSGSNVDDIKAINNLAGWSGSGLYKEVGEGLYLIGILARLTDQEHTYKSIHCIAIQTLIETINHNQLGSFQLDKKENPKTILFNAYMDSSEPYYIKRNEDDAFMKNLAVNNLWVFGMSGKGKTALINRNLLFHKVEYLFCDLSPVTISSENDILEEILNTAEDTFNIKKCTKETNKIKLITKLLNNASIEDIVIVVDEMSIVDEDLFKKIATSFINLVTYYTNTGTNKTLKFVISTRMEPTQGVVDWSKAMDYFQYICCDDWEEYLEKLFYTLCVALDLDIEDNDKDYIITNSNGSPRVLKKIFKNLLLVEPLNKTRIKEVVIKSLDESF